MKKVLFLYGMCCTTSVWDEVQAHLSGIDPVFAEYPHEITEKATTVSDIARWVYQTYGGQHFDAIAGHSLGGLVALQTCADYAMDAGAVVLIESFLRPAGAFYTNLMLPAHMVKYGDRINFMLRSEAPYYADALRRSVQEDFDFTPQVRKCQTKLCALYGNRGLKNYRRRVSDLCLDPETENSITFQFIKNACHMPMIENPLGLAEALKECMA